MTIRKVWGSRVDQPVAETFVGKKGTLFFNEPGSGLTNGLRISDGVTPGGIPISLPPATTSTIGGIRPGPGIEISGSGLLTIDAAGLPISFGDFYADGNNLSTVNANENFNILSNGTGTINLTGGVNVYDAMGVFGDQPIFKVKADGQIQMFVPGADSTEGAVAIIGGLDGVFQPTVNTGVMLHITGIAGTPGIPSRVYNDAQNAFAAFVARRYNNTAASPQAVLADEEIMRISGTAYNGTLIPGSANQRIVYKALGNQTLTNQGGYIEFWTTPLNSTTTSLVATVNNAAGITSTRFTGPLFGNVVATTVTATNLIGALSPSSQLGITSVGTLTNLTVANTVTSNFLSGKIVHPVRNAGTIAAAGTLTVDFSQDTIIYCTWSDGMTLAYTGFAPGRVVRIMAKKAAGSGTDSISLDGVTANQVSSGATTVSAGQDTTVFIECICVGTALGDVYVKL